MTTMRIADALRLTHDALVTSGMPNEHARVSAKAIVASEAWGIPSHGLMRLPFYLERLSAGGINPAAKLTTVVDLPALIVMDGDDGLGHWQVHDAAAAATARALTTGIAAAGVARSSHCGALGVYAWPMVRTGMIGIIVSNGPAAMPPWGGSRPVLSTSPIAAGLPTDPPTIIDLATSAVARGKIAARAQSGEPLEPGWALDAEGNPTTDAQEALRGMLAPLGGAKGYALALLVESLTGGLLGPLLSTQIPDMFNPGSNAAPQQISHLVIAIDYDRIQGALGGQRLADLSEEIAAAGGRMPGSRRVDPEQMNPDATFTLAEPVHAQLMAWQQRLGLSG